MSKFADSYEFDGKTGDLKFWSQQTGVQVNTLRRRLAKGFPLEDVFYVGNMRKRSAKKQCGVEGCGDKTQVVVGKYCRSHQYRLDRYGSPASKKRTVTKEKAYLVWQNMKASGVEIEWNSYEDFAADLGQPTGKNAVICRRDWNRGYSKDNCFWGTKAQSRHARRLTVNGVEKKIVEWARETGLNVSTISYRMEKGLSPEEVLRKRRKDSWGNIIWEPYRDAGTKLKSMEELN